MTIRTIAVKSLAVTALSASLLGLAAGTASAKPIEDKMGNTCQGTLTVDYTSNGEGRVHIGYTCYWRGASGTQIKDHYDENGEYHSTFVKKGRHWVHTGGGPG